MTQSISKLLATGFILLLLLIVVTKFKSISVKKNNVDELNEHLAPLVKHLRMNSRTGFYTDITNDNSPTTLYFRTEFVAAPLIIRESLDYDTVIAIVSNHFNYSKFAKYKTLVQNKDSSKTYALLVRTK
jgi:hypothetical protein